MTSYKRSIVFGITVVTCLVFGTAVYALNIPGFGTGGTAGAPSPQPPARFDCSKLQNISQYDSYKLNMEDVDYCIETKAFDPPRHWSRPGGEVYRGEATSMSFSSKCLPRNPSHKCKAFATTTQTAGGNPAVPPPPTVANNPNLRIPPFRPPASGPVSLPCGGSAPLDIGRLISQGGSFINNVRMGNVSSAVSTGVQIANSLFGGGCNGGIMNMIQGAINMVMPAGCTVNVTSGMAAACNGSVLSLPGGVTMQVAVGGSLTLPNGGTFSINGSPVSVGNNVTINVTGSGTNLQVTTSDGQSFTIANASELSVDTNAVLVPEGTQLPLDTSQNILPSSLPTP